MTKAALDNATSAMAVELAKHKVGQIHSIYCASHLLRPSPLISQQFISWPAWNIRYVITCYVNQMKINCTKPLNWALKKGTINRGQYGAVSNLSQNLTL